MRNLLLFRIGGLGDLLAAFPSIYFLRKALSSCWISLVCRREYGKLLKATGVVDELTEADDQRLAPFFSKSLSFEGESRLYLERFDLIIGWMQKERTLNIEKSWLDSQAKDFRLFTYENQSQEQVSRFFFRRTKKFLKEKGEKSLEFSECILLPLSPTQREEGMRLLASRDIRGSNKIKEKIIVVHPGSGSKSKCWPLENYLTIIRRLNQSEVRGALVTGVAEEWMEKDIRKSELPENWVWLKNPPLLKLAGLLRQASFYLGNDSGITHLAAVCGAKGVGLFRKNLEASWKPYGQVNVLSGYSLADIEVDTVWETLKRNLFMNN